MVAELDADQLCRCCDPDRFTFVTTADVKDADSIVGQPRATAALRFGLAMGDRGYHIFIAGPSGTGKTTAVNAFLAEAARNRPPTDDTCYVYNFADPEQPRVLRLPPGRGRELAHDLDELLTIVRRQLPRAFESDEYTNQRDALLKGLASHRRAWLSALTDVARTQGFHLDFSPSGLDLIPLTNGRPMQTDEINALSPAERAAWQLKESQLAGEIRRQLKDIQGREAAVQDDLARLDRDVALTTIGGLIEDVTERYAGLPAVSGYLAAVRDDLVVQADLFRATEDVTGSADPAKVLQRERTWRRYRINVLVDGSATAGAPVVAEAHPTYQNLLGRIEHEAQLGVLVTDFTLIRSGALHRANGGYLAMRAEDILRQPQAWDGLKRALRNRELVVEEPSEAAGLTAVRSLRPEPVPLDVKVVLTGDPALFHLLHAVDPDFPDLFRIHSDFSEWMPWTPQNEDAIARFVGRICKDEGLPHFERDAVAALIAHAARRAEDAERLTARFGLLCDLIREASYWSKDEGARTVRGQHVRKALDQQVYRSGLVEENLQEMLVNGTLLVDTAGAAIGQVNGLGVYSYAEYRFAVPGRITATVGIGRAGVIDVEREANLGGRIHSKGVLILAGFLADRFARRQPLAVSARLTFEQSYGEVDGDSASSAELYALLSRLADAPIKQCYAVTGSVNQKGEIQSIGGVNEKIEGFFATCRARGLTGEQGVLIPAANVRNLMLRHDVVDAVRAGRFHVYPIRTADEGIELLTGVPAGRRGADGCFPADSLNGRIEARLGEMGRTYRAVSSAVGDDGQVPSQPSIAAPHPVPPRPAAASRRRRTTDRGNHREPD